MEILTRWDAMYLGREGICGVSALALLTAVSNQAIQLNQIILRHLRAIQLLLRGLWRGGSMAGNHGHASIVCTQCFTLASIARPGRELRGMPRGAYTHLDSHQWQMQGFRMGHCIQR